MILTVSNAIIEVEVQGSVDLRRSAFKSGHSDTRHVARSLPIRQVSVAHRSNVHGIVGTEKDRDWLSDKGRNDARSWTIHPRRP